MCAGARGGGCAPGFAACAARREATGRARGGRSRGARAGARDPSLAPVHDADAHDAAIVSFVFSSGRFKKVCLSHAARECNGPAGEARGERGDADAGLEAGAASPKDVRRW